MTSTKGVSAIEKREETGSVRADDAVSVYHGYDVVVFDCDGVLLDSNNFKSGIFRDVLAAHGYPESEIDAFTDFQKRNFGTSRYRLFQAVVDGQFGEVRKVSCDALIAAFGEMCHSGYVEQAESPGLRASLDRAQSDGRALYVVSGSDEEELRAVFAARGLTGYFREIYGSPRTKDENMRLVRDAHPPQSRILFVGDAEADMNAARAAGADFIFMARYSQVRDTLEPRARDAGYVVIEDLREL